MHIRRSTLASERWLHSRGYRTRDESFLLDWVSIRLRLCRDLQMTFLEEALVRGLHHVTGHAVTRVLHFSLALVDEKSLVDDVLGWDLSRNY